MADSTPDNGSWQQYQKLVLSELRRLDERVGCVDKKLDIARLEIVGLKVKASLWGFIAGTIPAIGALLLLLLRNRL